MPRIQGRIDPDGLVVPVTVMLSAIDEADRQDRGLVVPPSFSTLGLIDTGATRTVIHPLITRYFGLTSLAHTLLTISGGATFDAPLYDVRLLWNHDLPASAPFELQVLSIAPANSTVLVVIGRDILERIRLLYDGPGKTFRLRF